MIRLHRFHICLLRSMPLTTPRPNLLKKSGKISMDLLYQSFQEINDSHFSIFHKTAHTANAEKKEEESQKNNYDSQEAIESKSLAFK